MASYKFKVQLDLNMPFVDDPSARLKAEVLLAAIQKLLHENCNTPRPTLERVVLVNQDRRDGFNILAQANEDLRAL
jgi:hypothetical protein